MRKSDVIMMVLPDGEILPMEQAKDYCNLTIEKIATIMEVDKTLNQDNSIPIEKDRYQERRRQSEVMLRAFESTLQVIEIIENAQKGE